MPCFVGQFLEQHTEMTLLLSSSELHTVRRRWGLQEEEKVMKENCWSVKSQNFRKEKEFSNYFPDERIKAQREWVAHSYIAGSHLAETDSSCLSAFRSRSRLLCARVPSGTEDWGWGRWGVLGLPSLVCRLRLSRFFFFFLILIYLAVLGLSCGMQDFW